MRKKKTRFFDHFLLPQQNNNNNRNIITNKNKSRWFANNYTGGSHTVADKPREEDEEKYLFEFFMANIIIYRFHKNVFL